MISGTGLVIQPPEYAEKVCRALVGRDLLTDSEILRIRAQCEGERALCLACDDGMAVVELCPHEGALELFIWIAVAFTHGAVERQHAALLKIACDFGAKTIAFQSRRRGWARRLGPEWRHRGDNEFERRVHGWQERRDQGDSISGGVG